VRLEAIRSAVGFLTVIPIARADGAPGQRLGRSLFPAVGLLLGLMAAAAMALGSLLAGPALGAVAALVALAVLTGGIHLDAVGDCADGLFSSGDRTRRLEVMRDPQLGSFGVVALVLLLLAEVAALTHLGPARAAVALIAAGALSRLAMLAVLVELPYVRAEGLGRAALGRGRRDLVLGVLLTLPALLLDWPHALVAAGAAALGAAGVAALARARIGGATGDVYGATLEVAQLSALLAFAVRL